MALKFIDLDTGLPTLWQKIKDTFVAKESGKGLSANDYTTKEKNKLAGIADNANNYSLPTASADTLGGIKVGSNLTITDGVLSADAQKVAVSAAQGSYTSGYKVGAVTIDGTTTTFYSPTSVSSAASATKATQDASGNVITSTYLTKTSASSTYLTKTDASSTYQTAAQVQSAINSALTSAMTFRGTVAAEADLPTADQKVGDMYNITASSSYGGAGMNVAWNGTAWDAMAPAIDVEAATAAEVQAKCV